VRHFVGHRGSVNGVALSSDGRSLLTRGGDKSIRIWEFATGKERCRFEEKGDNSEWSGTQFLALSPNGRVLVSAGTNDPIGRVWDVAAAKELAPLTGHHGWIGVVDFSADGATLLTGSQDTTCLLWDMTDAARQPRRADRQLTEPELNRCWTELRDPDAAKAYRAMWTLAGAGDQSVAHVAERTRPVAPSERQRITQWIAELDHAQFAVRERASAALAQVVDQAQDELRAALANARSEEARQRIRRLLDDTAEAEPSGERLAELRVIELLEVIATPKARQVLEALGRGAPGAHLTVEALAACRRLDAREKPR
jgi:hypothetical protein